MNEPEEERTKQADAEGQKLRHDAKRPSKEVRSLSWQDLTGLGESEEMGGRR